MPLLLAATLVGAFGGPVALEELMPLRPGDRYVYWSELGEARDSVTMRVLEARGGSALVEGLPAPASLAGGKSPGILATVRIDPATRQILVRTDDGEGPLCTVPEDAPVGPVSTWAADYAEGLTVPLVAVDLVVEGTVTLARGLGIVAIRFRTVAGEGEYVLLQGPGGPAAEPPPAALALQPGKTYRYVREDALGRSPWECRVLEGVDLDGATGVRALGLPWFDEAARRPLQPRERTLAIDVAGRRFLELVDGSVRELLRFNVSQAAETVVVPAGSFTGCYRIASSRPGMEVVVHPSVGAISWRFDTIVGPVRYDLVRVTDDAPPSEPAGPSQPPGPSEPAGPPAGTAATEPAGPDRPVGPHPAMVLAAGSELFTTSATGDLTAIPTGGPVVAACASRDGTRIAWIESAGAAERLRALVGGAPADPLGSEAPPGELGDLAWSPSGAQLAFRLGREIRVWALDQPARPALTGAHPLWLSDEELLFEVGPEGTAEEVGLFRVAAAGGTPTMAVPWGYQAGVSADGAVLAYVSPCADDDPRLYVRRGAEEIRIETSTRWDRSPALSPDGSRLAWVRADASGETLTYSIRVLDLASGSEAEVAAKLSVVPIVAFGPDGALLCACLPPEDPPTCFAIPPASPSDWSQIVSLGARRLTWALPVGAPARRP